MKAITLVVLLCLGISSQAQPVLPADSQQLQPHPVQPRPLQWSAYLELYYAYDFNQPSDHRRPSFVYSHNRHHELNLNLGLVRAAYAADRLRANMSLMAGTYTNANMAAEPGVLKQVYEANAGLRLSKTKALWLDAGIMPSHIGFESAIGRDCWNLTRSIIADNSPYFETGVKLSYTTADSRWYLALLYLNGWQRIQRPPANNTPAFGTQLSFRPSARLTINSSGFVGNEFPDSARRMRYFHNCYMVWQPLEKLGLILDFDFGIQQQARRSRQYDEWYGTAAIVRWQPGKKTWLAGRAEYYHDPNHVIVSYAAPRGFRCAGYSLNLDHAVFEQALLRLEAKMLSSPEQIFDRHGTMTNNNVVLTAAIAVSL